MAEHNLIDRYVNEVGNQLPRRDREDVQLELRSALHDMLEERGLDPNKEDHRVQIAEMLKEFGHPEKVSASYRPSHYLVGPQLFPAYELVVKIVWIVMTGLFSLGLIVGGLNAGSIWQQAFDFFGGYVQALFQSLGIITIIFYILQRTGAVNGELAEGKDWDPLKLPEVQDPDRINQGELVAGIIFTAALLVVFNAFLDQLGIPVVYDGQPGLIAAFTQDFKTFVPVLSVLWAAEIALKITVLNKGRWQTWTRSTEAVLEAAGLYVLYRIITEATILDLAIVDTITKGVLWVILVIVALDLLSKLYRLAVPGHRPPWQRFNFSSR
jgi:hypothetical protein